MNFVRSGPGVVSDGGTRANLPAVSTPVVPSSAPPPTVLPFQQVTFVLRRFVPNQFVDPVMFHWVFEAVKRTLMNESTSAPPNVTGVTVAEVVETTPAVF